MRFSSCAATRSTFEVNLNADIGEGAGSDEAILPHVDSANVACGVHAGSVTVAIATARRCRELGVENGAHPGYDDRSGFGRSEMGLTAEEIEALVAFQVAGLAAVFPIAYVKPHGALYHRCQADSAAADAVARVAKAHGVGIVGYREGYGDRRLLDDGSLAPRTEPGALLDPGAAAEQSLRLARSGQFDTICIHGDTKDAAEVAAQVRRAFREGGLETGPLARA